MDDLFDSYLYMAMALGECLHIRRLDIIVSEDAFRTHVQCLYVIVDIGRCAEHVTSDF